MAKSAKTKRGGDENLFSVSGASDALGRSRRTITRALQGVRPAAIRSGLKLWTMHTIIDAVNRNTQAPVLTSASVSGDLQYRFAELDEADAEMRGIEPLAGRPAFARKTLLPLLREVDAAMRSDGKACGELAMLTQLRCDQHLRVFLVAGLGPDATGGCDWTPGQCWGAYNAGADDEGDEAA
jgi:hypothetical protein